MLATTTTQMAKRGETAIARPPHVLVPLIKTELEKAREAGAEYYRRAGEMLIEAKRGVAHGDWGKWLSKNFHLHERTARSYMRDARAEEDQNGNLEADLVRPKLRPGKPNTAAWYKPVQQEIKRVDVDRIVAERKSQKEEEKLVRDLAEQIISIGFKVLATKLHPDRRGSTEAMTRLSAARNLLKEALR